MFKQYRPVELPSGAYDVVMYREEDGAVLRAIVRQVPDRALAVEIAEELCIAYKAGVLTGSHEHMKADVNAFLEESAERLERREMFKESNPGF